VKAVQNVAFIKTREHAGDFKEW